MSGVQNKCEVQMTQSPLQSRPGPVQRLRVQLRARQVALQRPGESDGFRLVCCTSNQDERTGWEVGLDSRPVMHACAWEQALGTN